MNEPAMDFDATVGAACKSEECPSTALEMRRIWRALRGKMGASAHAKLQQVTAAGESCVGVRHESSVQSERSRAREKCREGIATGFVGWR
jgi:hypothetical protein